MVGTQDLVAYDLAVDALEHPGPADEERAKASDPGICTPPPLGLMPGINPATYPTDAGIAAANLLTTIATYSHVPAEPALACYVTASGGQAATAGRAKCKKRKHKKQKKCKKKRRG
jgi:hypothetical protein